jgi:hypothetical protein
MTKGATAVGVGSCVGCAAQALRIKIRSKKRVCFIFSYLVKDLTDRFAKTCQVW